MCRYLLLSGLFFSVGLLGGRAAAEETETWDGKIVLYGEMHKAIGQQQHEARVQLKKLVERPHFYGVAALTGLAGEATVIDGKPTVTRVDAQGQLTSAESGQLDESATLLVGAYVPAWTERRTTKAVAPDAFDKYVADEAQKAGMQTSEPFIFTVEGEFAKVRLHVIHGACPLHARLKKVELPPDKQPFEAEFEKVRGMAVGVFAKDAVGKITHPATSTHLHLVFQDPKTGKVVTGHVERMGLMEGALLRLPRMK